MNTLSSPFRTRLADVADGLAIAVVVSLPWSNSAASFLIFLWLAATVPSLRSTEITRELATPAGSLPFALFILGFVGMAWADASWPERLGGVDSFFKLATIPLLIAQFRRSDRGHQAMIAYLISCTALLIVSFALMIWPPVDPERFGVPVKGATTQSGEFILCILILPYLAIDLYRRGRTKLALGIFLLAIAFLANVVCVVTATLLTRFFFILVLPLIVMPILLLILLVKRQFGRTSALAVIAVGVALGGAAWIASSDLRQGAATAWLIIEDYSKKSESRPAYWRRSIEFISEAPIIGHGTGSTLKLFSRSADDPTGQSGPPTTNPHQQTLAIGIQIGLIGMALLWAMWLSHLLLFRGATLSDWVGTVIVAQSIASSLLDTQLFDFTQGWTYVFGVGIAGGVIRKFHTNQAKPMTTSQRQSKDIRANPTTNIALHEKSQL